MKIVDVIFALIAGKVIGSVASTFLKEFGVILTLSEAVILWLAFPLFSLACLWLCFLIGRKLLFVYQAGKHLLVGAFATVIDLKLFEFLIWLSSFFLPISLILAKSISFIFSTIIKYWGNKYWAFQKHEKEDARKEMAQFFLITLCGLVIDISVFYYLSAGGQVRQMFGPEFIIQDGIWVKISVLFAAIVAAIWNFLGYKFFVFKK